MRTRGFTLIELALVLAVIGILTTLSVAGLEGTIYRARAAEARATLEAIAHLERLYFRDHGRYVACEASPAVIPRGGKVQFEPAHVGWSDLGFKFPGEIRYRYQVQLSGGSFQAIAEGDLNGDGKASHLALDGQTLVVTAQDELE